jgi:two-component system, response regulator
MEEIKKFIDVEILFVEDNPSDAELTLRAFSKSKLANKIYHVEDGEEALDFIFARGKFAERKDSKKPKLIILDLKLPKIDGLEVLKELKSNDATKIIPVVVLTSSKEEKDIVESYKIGVNSYISKPVDFDKFMISVKEIGFYWLLLNHPPVI